MEISTKRILFFDGVCKLCHGVVDWFIPLFNPNEIYFAPLQGETARQILSKHDLGLDSVVYYRNGQIHKKSKAIIWLILDSQSSLRYAVMVVKYIPPSILDKLYDFIARIRYYVFGKTEQCRIPHQNERVYFLD